MSWLVTNTPISGYTSIDSKIECGVTLFWHLFFCSGKLSDALYVPPWRIGLEK